MTTLELIDNHNPPQEIGVLDINTMPPLSTLSDGLNKPYSFFDFNFSEEQKETIDSFDCDGEAFSVYKHNYGTELREELLKEFVTNKCNSYSEKMVNLLIDIADKFQDYFSSQNNPPYRYIYCGVRIKTEETNYATTQYHTDCVKTLVTFLIGMPTIFVSDAQVQRIDKNSTILIEGTNSVYESPEKYQGTILNGCPSSEDDECYTKDCPRGAVHARPYMHSNKDFRLFMACL